VAVVASGYGLQSLVMPGSMSSSQAELLDALLTAPQGPSAAAPGAPDLNRQGAMAERAMQTAAPLDPQRTAPPGSPLNLEIRVALLGASGQPSLTAQGPWRLLDRDGRVLQSGPAGVGVDLAAVVAAGPEAWLESAAGQVALLVNGRPYAGRLRLLRDGAGVQVVNHLPLESYISSVVGAEMPSSWNLEALKAQAVAARSYAMAHMARPANDHWHLGDTTRWQAYRGLDSVQPRTLEATAATAGVILSYKGGIVESLYASTSQISAEAHGHLGASMSQHGAQDLASSGLRYEQILAHYYRGASLARLQNGAG
jgi:hypothetical protein